ncbi:MAG: hypothetical protein JSR59_02550 [Proteobacteria bacterium]|nr:hypothetical protein [Pseudomonadota bacterium]
MKLRQAVIFTGQTFMVPEGIQRIDHRATHGWQVRYDGTKMFSDHTKDGSGASAALDRATKELLKRINSRPAPSGLQRDPNANKTSDLPVGISGPIVRLRKGQKVRECNFAVSLPRYGQTPRKRTVYIGNENTFTNERYWAALARAIEMRETAAAEYQAAATRAKRAAGRKLRGEAAAAAR